MKTVVRPAMLLLLAFCFATVRGGLYGQSSPGEDIRQEMDLARRLLEETRSKGAATPSDVGVIDYEIRLTRSLISKFQKEIETNEAQIAELEETICQLENDLENIRESFAQNTVITYKKSKTLNFWVMVLSARNLTHAFYRAIYYRQFARYRANQIKLIQQARFFLEVKKDDLNRMVSEKKQLLDAKGKASIRLAATETEQQTLITELKKKGAVKTGARLSPIAGLDGASGVNPELGVDKGSFEKSRGVLPWPVSVREAVVVSFFGATEDPFGNQVMNDGIQIRTTRGQQVRAVYKGEVTGVQSIPMSGYVVMVQHGNYRTVYDNLTDVSVQANEIVEQSTVLGKVRTDPRTNETLLHFLIYRNTDKFVDPLRWLAPKR